MVISTDEENGGPKGIKLFVLTSQFKNLNIGFMLDEGLPNENPDEFNYYYTQRMLVCKIAPAFCFFQWCIRYNKVKNVSMLVPCISAGAKFTAYGRTGHGSLLLNDTAAEKIQKVINKMLNLREEEKMRFEGNNSLALGDVTTINLNMLEVRLIGF